MAAYAITGDIAIIKRDGRNTITLHQGNEYVGIELSDDRLTKLYATYCALLVEQRFEDAEKSEQS